MYKAEQNDKYKKNDRFNFAFDIIFFLPRQIVRMMKWLF